MQSAEPVQKGEVLTCVPLGRSCSVAVWLKVSISSWRTTPSGGLAWRGSGGAVGPEYGLPAELPSPWGGRCPTSAFRNGSGGSRSRRTCGPCAPWWASWATTASTPPTSSLSPGWDTGRRKGETGEPEGADQRRSRRPMTSLERRLRNLSAETASRGNTREYPPVQAGSRRLAGLPAHMCRCFLAASPWDGTV